MSSCVSQDKLCHIVKALKDAPKVGVFCVVNICFGMVK